MNSITFKEVDLKDEKLVQSVLIQAPQYFLNVEGQPPGVDQAYRGLNLLPDGCPLEQKHSYVIFEDDEPVGFADLYAHFRVPRMATLSLFLLVEKKQGVGLGRHAYQSLEYFIRSSLHCRIIRIGVIDSNPVQRFWMKMGYSFTGDTKPHFSTDLSSTMRAMQKLID